VAERGVTIVTLSPVAPWPPAAEVCTVPWTRNPAGATAGLKTTSYADNAIALRHAQERGADEALFANTAGMVCEGAGSNVFAVVDGRLVTPPLSSGCLAGVTRELVLEWLPEAVEKDVRLATLAGASEIFLTATSRDVHPVAVLDGRELDAVPGPCTTAAMKTFAEMSVDEWSAPTRTA
jgi:branched-chain amino acid aminotransferase